MDEIIRRSLEMMEANLKAEVTLVDLADQAGYSRWHFSRLFAEQTGQSVAQFLLRRRLDGALGEIASGKRAVDVVLAYGFETYSGFYRAFVKLYGCSPKKYLRIYGSYAATKTEVTMKHYTKKELRRVLAHWGMEKEEIGEVPVMYDDRPDDAAWQIGGEYRLRTGDRVRCLKDLRIAQALAAQGFGACVPVPTLDGKDYVEGEEIFTLSRVAPGERLTVSACYGATSPARAYGEGIARLHGALRGVAADVPWDQGNLLNDVMNWALPAIRKQNEQWSLELSETFFTGWQERFVTLYPKLPRQLIHRNVCRSYVMMRDGQVTGFEQFDMLQEEIRLFDVCYAATGILTETGDEALYPRWLDVLADILRGYDSVSAMTAEEKRAVYDVICGIQMICVAYFGEHEVDRELARRNRAMLSFIAAQQETMARML